MTTFTSGYFTPHNLVSRISKIALAAAVLTASPWAASMTLAAENWVACEGMVSTTTTKDGQAETVNAPARDVYAYDDANKMLFKYSEKRKALDPVFVTGFDDKTIGWANAGGASAGTSAANWQGSLDRASMALKMTRKEKGEVMTWEQQCKATQPQPMN